MTKANFLTKIMKELKLIRKIFKVYIHYLLIFHLISYVCFTSADLFEDASVRSRSMGGCFYPGDLVSIGLNPAAGALLESSQILASHNILLMNGRFNTLGFSKIGKNSSISVIINQFSRNNVEVRETLTSDPLFASVNQSNLFLSYSYVLPYDIYSGVSLKTYYYELYDTKSNLPLGLDLALYRNFLTLGDLLKNDFNLRANLGVGFLNVVEPKIVMGNETDTLSGKYSLHLDILFSFLPKYNPKKDTLNYEELMLLCDYKERLSLGLQYRKEILMLRVGYIDKTFSKISFGLGLSFNKVSFNYAFVPFIDNGLHSLDFIYKWGSERKLFNVSADFDEYYTTKNKALKIYQENIKAAKKLIEEDKLLEAKSVLEKILPLFPDKKQGHDLYNFTKKTILYKLIDKVNLEYPKLINNAKYKDAFEYVLNLVDFAPEDDFSKSLVKDFNNKGIDDADISNMKFEYVNSICQIFDEFIAKKDFDTSYKQLLKLKLIAPNLELTSKRESRYNKEKEDYADYLIKKAENVLSDKIEAYDYYKYAYKLTNNKEIKTKMESFEKKFAAKNIKDEINQKKLYLLAAVFYAEGDYEKSKSTLNKLKTLNITYNYTLLEDALRESNFLPKALP